jgi:hypothetical protein
MPLQTSNYMTAKGVDVTLLAATALTVTGQTTGMDVGGADTLRCQVQVSAVSGTTPSITVTVQTSHDNGVTDAWRTAGAAYGAITTVSNSPYQCFVIDRYVRVSYVISGTTPSLTTAVVAEAA